MIKKSINVEQNALNITFQYISIGILSIIYFMVLYMWIKLFRYMLTRNTFAKFSSVSLCVRFLFLKYMFNILLSKLFKKGQALPNIQMIYQCLCQFVSCCYTFFSFLFCKKEHSIETKLYLRMVRYRNKYYLVRPVLQLVLFDALLSVMITFCLLSH